MIARIHLLGAAALIALCVNARAADAPPPAPVSPDGFTAQDFQLLNGALTLSAQACVTSKDGCIIGFNAPELRAKLAAAQDALQKRQAQAKH